MLKKLHKNSNKSLLSELLFFLEEPLVNIELSKEHPFFPLKRKKRSKKTSNRLTKHQILQNILPFYDSAGIVLLEHAHQHAAETYDVEVIDNKSLDDSLFLAKKRINDLFRDLLREKKRWNNPTNTYDILTKNIKAKAITVNQRFNLNNAYEELKHRLDIWTGKGSGWIIDNI